MHPLQVATYVFGVFNAIVCIGLFFFATHKSGMSMPHRLMVCATGISAVAYLSLRVSLIYEGIH